MGEKKLIFFDARNYEGVNIDIVCAFYVSNYNVWSE